MLVATVMYHKFKLRNDTEGGENNDTSLSYLSRNYIQYLLIIK